MTLFLGARDADRIGATDDRRFAVFAHRRLGVTTLCLHTGERVEGHDEGQVEFVLQSMTCNSRQPIVCVQHVGTAVCHDVVTNTVGKLIDNRKQFALRQVEITGRNMHHAVVGFDLHDPRKLGVPRTGVRGAVEAGVGECGNQFTNVDVHSATVADTGLRQR